jgi:signal transduction histidine kinase
MLQSLLRTWHTRELLGVRLERNDQLLGLLLVARSASAEPMSRRDRHLLSRIAFQAASTLSQANLVADLQAANQLKEEFMATMSHELRTPLNVIIGYTDLQLDGAYGELTGEHRQALERIRDQSMQLLELIQATLDVSRLERGLLSLNLEDISIPQFMDELQQNIPSNWRKPTVALNYRIAPGIPMIRTDPAKLYILARNLIHNALKFTSSGAVTVSFSVNPNKQKVTFVVQDSGIGIKPEHLSDIFEKFRQIPAPDAEWVPSGGGVGLGLYIAKRLATVLGAEIDVSSTPRRGSTFRVHLPVGGPLAARR